MEGQLILSLVGHAAKIWNVTPELIISQSKLAKAVEPRCAICFVAYRRAGFKAHEIATVLNRDRSTISTAAARAQRLMIKAPIFAERLERLSAMSSGLLSTTEPTYRRIPVSDAMQALTSHVLISMAEFRDIYPDAFAAAMSDIARTSASAPASPIDTARIQSAGH
jgi:hypothetical protein